MQVITNFSVRVKHDGGIVRIKIAATDEESAKKMVATTEGCPMECIISVRQLKT